MKKSGGFSIKVLIERIRVQLRKKDSKEIIDQDDKELRKNYIDRIYDTYIDEDELQVCDKKICEIADNLEPKSYTSREFIKELGKFLKKNAKKKGSLIE